MLLPDPIPQGLPTLSDDATNGRSFANQLARVESLAKQHAERVNAIETSITTFIDGQLEGYAGLTAGTMNDDLRNGIKDQVRVKAERDGKEFRVSEHAKHSAALDAWEKDAHAAEQLLSNLMSAIGDSPAGLVGYMTLTDQTMRARRSEYQNALQFASHAELRNAAIVAASTNDLPLTAAILTHLDRLPREQRPIHPAELASKIAGEKYTQMRTARDKARLAVSKMLESRRVLRTGSPSSVRKIAHGLCEMEIAGGK